MELRDVLSSLNDDELIEVISDAAAELSASDAQVKNYWMKYMTMFQQQHQITL
jgi:hypothetical protein